MPVIVNNPAARLFGFLEAARGDADINPNRQASHSLYSLVGLKHGDVARLTHRFGHITRQATLAREQVMQLPVNQQLHLRWYEPVVAALEGVALNLSTPWGAAMQHVDKAVLLSLEHCSELLSTSAPEVALSREDLTDLAETLADCERQSSEANLPPDVRQIVQDYLQGAWEALSDYGVAGISELRKSFRDLAGTLAVNRDVWLKVPDEVRERVWVWFQRLAHAVTIGNGAPQIVERVLKFLE